MKTRRLDWWDTKEYVVRYSFQVKPSLNGRWSNVMEDGVPLMFSTPEERDVKQAEYRKLEYLVEI